MPLSRDPYFDFVIGFPNSPILPESFGTLDASGKATSPFQLIPNLPARYAGITFDHAALVFCKAQSPCFFDLFTNARPVTLVP